MKENISMATAVLAIVISIVAIASAVVIGPVSTIGASSVGENELKDNSVTGDKVADGALTDDDISNIGISKIADDAIAGDQIAGSSITLLHLSPGVISAMAGETNVSAVIEDNSVTSAKIANGTITDDDITDTGISKIADNAITLAHLTSAVIDAMTGVTGIADNSITSAKITDGTIVNVDISDSADIAPSKILGTAWTATNDGAGSGLDADTLDGINSGELIRDDSGTANYIPKFTGSTTIGNSIIYETVGGNVGIGTTSPQQPLQIRRDTADRIVGFSTDSDTPNYVLGVDETDNKFKIHSGSGLADWSDFIIDSSGNVGIGMPSEGANLQIYDSTAPILVFDRGGVDFYIGEDGNYKLYLGTGLTVGSNAIVTLDSSGNVGIGTTSPSPTSKLHVIGKGTFTGGVDPPYISFSKESHESIRQYAEDVEEHEEVMQFWNGEAHRMEIYVISEDAFYTITGELVEE